MANKRRGSKGPARQAEAGMMRALDEERLMTGRLATLARLREDRVYVEWRIAREVAGAREEGRTWAQIAEHLGVSASAAHQRYGPSSGVRPS